MPARGVATARQERLGGELRKLRDRAGLTVRQASRATGIAESKISMTEAGRVGLSEERVRYFAEQYACDDSAHVDALVAMAKEPGRGWWSEYRGSVPPAFMDLAELEHHATYLRSFESVHIPGLLQIADHIRALYSASLPEVSRKQAHIWTEFRLRRQEVLGRVPFDVVMHEAALRIRVADREVARRQLLYLAEQSERPRVTVRVVPFDRDGFTRAGNALLLAGGAVRKLDTVLLDNAYGGVFVDAEARLDRFRRVLRDVEHAAVGAVESRDLIHRLAQQM